METFQEFGHCLFIGPTNSGKTYLAQYLLAELRPDKVWVFKDTATRDWREPIFNATDKFKETLPEILQHAVDFPDQNRIVIFDDFNHKIDTIRDKDYGALFTRGRHMNLRVFNMLHGPKAIGPLARNNSRFVFIMAAAIQDTNAVRALAMMYLGDKYELLRGSLEDASARHPKAAVLLDTQNPKKVDIVLAPARGKQTQQPIRTPQSQPIPTPAAAQPISTGRQIKYATIPAEPVDHEIPVMPNPDSPMAQGHQAAFVGLNPSFSIGNKQAHNLMDNSHNNFNVTPDIRQISMLNQQQYQERLQAPAKEYEISLEQQKYATHQLLTRGYMSHAEKSQALITMNRLLRPCKLVNGRKVPYAYTDQDFEKAKQQFLKAYFPDDLYLTAQKSNPIHESVLTFTNFMSASSLNERGLIALSAANAVAPKLVQKAADGSTRALRALQ